MNDQKPELPVDLFSKIDRVHEKATKIFNQISPEVKEELLNKKIINKKIAAEEENNKTTKIKIK